MNARTNFQKIKVFFTAFIASLTFVGCGSFQGASYFSSDGIYSTKTQVRTEQSSQPKSTNSSYYSDYFKDAAQGTVAENEVFFTDTDSYTSEQSYANENTAIESSQIPWGEKTSQTEVIIIDNSPNYLWGLSGFAFRASPFWSGYYFNDPFRFGYGGYIAPYYNPYINPYYGYGGFAGFWGYDPFYSPFGYYPGYSFGYRWNRWNRWNRWGGNNPNHHGYFGGSDYATTVARVNSGRGEKNYGESRRTERTQERNAKTKSGDVNPTPLNLLNVGRGISSLGNTYLLTNRRDAESKLSDMSKTRRPVYGSSGGSSINRANDSSTNPKGIQGSSNGRFTQSRYTLSNRTRTDRESRRSVNRSTFSSSRSSRTLPQRTSRSSNYNTTARRSYNSTPSYRTTTPSRSFNSGSSRSYSSSSGRSSSGGRRNP